MNVIDHLDAARRKSSKSACWAEAEQAAKLAGVEVYSDPNRPGWPDLERLAEAVNTRSTLRLIVTRHAGMLDWLAKNGITGQVISHAKPEDVKGRQVIGTLPFYLAAMANSVTVVDLPRLRPEQRGVDLTPEEMDAAGASLKTYIVKEVK